MTTMEAQTRYELYADYMTDRQSAAPQPLKSWIARYPQFASELAQWAANAPLVDALDDCPGDPAGEARVLAIGRQVVAEARARYEAAPAPLAGLVEAAKAKGLTVKTLTERLNIGRTTLAKLEQRLFRAASVPSHLVDSLAAALQVSAGQVRDYLSRPPMLAAAASYKSDGVPAVAAQEDFIEAVRSCPDMTPEQKEFWLHPAN